LNCNLKLCMSQFTHRKVLSPHKDFFALNRRICGSTRICHNESLLWKGRNELVAEMKRSHNCVAVLATHSLSADKSWFSWCMYTGTCRVQPAQVVVRPSPLAARLNRERVSPANNIAQMHTVWNLVVEHVAKGASQARMTSTVALQIMLQSDVSDSRHHHVNCKLSGLCGNTPLCVCYVQIII
jgi:hypothetical protein